MMKKWLVFSTCLLALTTVLSGCGTDEKSGKTEDHEKKEEITVFAAASLQDALTEIETAFMKDSEYVSDITFVFESSGTLQKQIEEGAPCDIFFSAALSNMDALETAHLIEPDSRKDLLGNTLSLVASAENVDTIKTLDDLKKSEVEKIAVGESEAVPAGKYAKESLTNLGLYDTLQSKFVYGNNVKQVLTYVKNGDADCGIVYKTDAILGDSAEIVLDLPEDSYSKIVYPAAIMKESADKKGTAEFYEYLSSDEATEIFKKYGFITNP